MDCTGEAYRRRRQIKIIDHCRRSTDRPIDRLQLYIFLSFSLSLSPRNMVIPMLPMIIGWIHNRVSQKKKGEGNQRSAIIYLFACSINAIRSENCRVLPICCCCCRCRSNKAQCTKIYPPRCPHSVCLSDNHGTDGPTTYNRDRILPTGHHLLLYIHDHLLHALDSVV